MSEDIVAWAMEMLEEGYDTESLVILAGLMKPLFRQEVEHYFKHAIRELGWTWPSDVALCLQAYALDVARAIIAGKIPPVEGCSEMYHIAGTLNYPKYLSAWVDRKSTRLNSSH